MLQQTISKEFSFAGIGLHTGKTVNVTVAPADVDVGIKFIRTDIDAEVVATVDNVTSTDYATTLESNNASISTIEHLLAALFAHQVDNAIIYVNGPEVPLVDGCATFFSRHIVNAGIVEQSTGVSIIKLPNARFDYNGSYIITSPSDEFTISAKIEFENVTQGFTLAVNPKSFRTKVARSKTFVHKNDIDKLKEMGLIKGGSLDNAVVLSDTGIINPENVVFENDMVRHKILDILGDFSLCRSRILGHIFIFRPGHTVNTHFIKKLLNGHTHD